MASLFHRIFGIAPWRREWQEALSHKLTEVQNGVPASFVVIIAKESDLYAEVLFIFCFLGLCLGALLSFFVEPFMPERTDVLIPPIAGFALGATVYTLRRFFITRLAPRAVRDRVAQKAKSNFFDHEQSLKHRLILLYFSEVEREALCLSSSDIFDNIPREAISKSLSQLIQNYSDKDPLKTLIPCLDQMGQALRSAPWSTSQTDAPAAPAQKAIFLGASDRKTVLKVPILKGSKDIN
jgi:uncharacterized membrane protein